MTTQSNNGASLKRMVRRKCAHIHTTPPRKLEEKHGYTKHGHGRHYIAVGESFDTANTIDRAWDRRCDASRWAKRAGVKTINHWYQI